MIPFFLSPLRVPAVITPGYCFNPDNFGGFALDECVVGGSFGVRGGLAAFAVDLFVAIDADGILNVPPPAFTPFTMIQVLSIAFTSLEKSMRTILLVDEAVEFASVAQQTL
ncbi:hypothetical protein PUV54_07530 [Hyphococcus flavus]|uniref:Uncharacterized protein n=1 Tax=Hyphococcus flavus TaxID=1866326 RepID=A0AAF0CH01_9PROT|nr:hypothetical protein [Hyphococcus flavus]WDI33044.1 hypothetical protein PUV54_07530 [Hyphococcus flavus]